MRNEPQVGRMPPGMRKPERPPAGRHPAGNDRPEEKEKKTSFDHLRENLEAVAVAVVLALIIRHFSVEAFEIPTGSMAPTLYGIHSWLKCPNCSTEFNVGLGSDTATGKLSLRSPKRLVYWGECPRCHLPHHRVLHDATEPKKLDLVEPGDTFVCPNDNFAWVGQQGDFSTWNVISEREMGLGAVCPNCWFEFREILTDWNKTGGHKILVDKYTYKMTRPRRWDVIVFQFNRE